MEGIAKAKMGKSRALGEFDERMQLGKTRLEETGKDCKGCLDVGSRIGSVVKICIESVMELYFGGIKGCLQESISSVIGRGGM